MLDVEETVSAASLLDVLGNENLYLMAPEDAVDGGDSVYADRAYHPSRYCSWWGEGVQYVSIRDAGWGDYVGSVWNRSNFRVLMESHREHLVEIRYAHGGHGLLVRLDSQIPQDLYDSIVGLLNYPVIDESDCSELESEIEQENWESWGRSDWMREIRKAASKHDPEEDVDELDEEGRADALFEEVRSTGLMLDWVSESADSGYWTDFERAAAQVWEQMRKERTRPYVIPGQLAMF